MNAVILRCKVNGEKTLATYICLYILSSTCRTDLIQSALDRGGSGASGKNFSSKFGPFFASLGGFEVTRLVKKRRNFELNLSFIHVTFLTKLKNAFLLR